MNRPIIFGLLITFSCSTMENRRMHADLVANINKKDYTAAIEIVNSETFYAEERSKLLRYLERGTTYYYAKMYFQALKEFDRAKELSDLLFTKSISSVAKGIFDGNQNEFYGERYERSLIRFYQSLIHYMLSIIGKYESWKEGEIIHPEKILNASEKKFHLNASKSVMREWNSIFAQYQIEAANLPTYKADLLEHLWGAIIYEQSTLNADQQVAKVFYRNAKDLLFENYNIYPSFNKKYKLFIENYARLKQLPRSTISSEYIEPTEFANNLTKYIDTKLNLKKLDNVMILLKEGLISEKEAKEEKLIFNADELMEMVYLQNYINTANTNNSNIDRYAFYTFAVAYLLKDITYDLPYIIPKETAPLKVEMTDIKGKVIEVPMILSAPLSEIAFKEIDDLILKEKAVLITRMTGEYIAAAVTAYLTYNEIKKENDSLSELLATSAAVVLFKSLGSAIKAHNRADLRQWKLLPSSIRLGSINLELGEYILTVKNSITNKILETQKVTVTNDPILIDLNYSDLN